MNYDITQRKRVEGRPRASEERFRAFMDHSPAAAWVTDAGGRIQYLSGTYLRMFQLPAGDPVGHSVFDVYPADIAREYLDNIRRVADGGRPIEAVEPGPRPDGTVSRFLVYKFPLPGEDRLVGGVAVDITERLRAEEALRDADRKKDDLIALLAHELRNSLTPIRNGLQVVRLVRHTGHRPAPRTPRPAAPAMTAQIPWSERPPHFRGARLAGVHRGASREKFRTSQIFETSRSGG